MKHKFKVGDRVRVTKIDDKQFYGPATYKVGDVGRIITVSSSQWCGRTFKYEIEFDRLKADNKDYEWWALEDWLVREISVMVFE